MINYFIYIYILKLNSKNYYTKFTKIIQSKGLLNALIKFKKENFIQELLLDFFIIFHNKKIFRFFIFSILLADNV